MNRKGDKEEVNHEAHKGHKEEEYMSLTRCNRY
jgi:uncharacterized protein YxeA